MSLTLLGWGSQTYVLSAEKEPPPTTLASIVGQTGVDLCALHQRPADYRVTWTGASIYT